MERRIARVNIGAAGGTAARGAKTCKVTLPTAWMDAMGITINQRELVLAFDGSQIMLTRRFGGSEFAKRQLAMGHEVRLIQLYDGENLCTVIYADYTGQEVVAENQAVPTVKTAFGNNPFPNWEDLQEFLAERCIPKQRAGLREYLETIGLEEYDPLHIIEKTGGRMAEDQQWVTVEVLKCQSDL